MSTGPRAMEPRRCDWSDLPVDQCDHCGAKPGNRPRPEPARPRIIGHNLFTEPATPPDPGPPLKLATTNNAGTCPCGQPTRNNAYGCDDCTSELHRFLQSVPWLIDQLDTSIARIKAKNPNANGAGGESLPWLNSAAIAHRRVTGLLRQLVRACERLNVTHQSPNLGPPTKGPVAASQWLLWRTDALPQHPIFPAILRAAMHTETRAHHVIDCAPDLLYLGPCEAPQCQGFVYAITGERTGHCRACSATLPTDESRTALYKELDARLYTAAEIGTLSTFLNLKASREQVRKLVNQWHKRGRLASRGHEGIGGDQRVPKFQYGEVRILLAETYDHTDKGA